MKSANTITVDKFQPRRKFILFYSVVRMLGSFQPIRKFLLSINGQMLQLAESAKQVSLGVEYTS